jgi:hypothetical protein
LFFCAKKFGKSTVLVPNNIINNIEIFFFLSFINVDIICHIIAHIIETIIIIIHFVGALFIISIHISNIFCQIAVDIARKIQIGIRNLKYLFIDHIMFGIFFVTALYRECFLKLISYFVSKINIVARDTIKINHTTPTHHKLS